jgi:hypothetical protein
MHSNSKRARAIGLSLLQGRDSVPNEVQFMAPRDGIYIILKQTWEKREEAIIRKIGIGARVTRCNAGYRIRVSRYLIQQNTTYTYLKKGIHFLKSSL